MAGRTQEGAGRRGRPVAGTLALAMSAVVAALPAQADVTGSATAHAGYGGRDVTSPMREESVPVVAADPRLAITRTSTDTAQSAAGQTITATYVLTNTGNQTLTDVALQGDHAGALARGERLAGGGGKGGGSSDAAADDGVWSVLAPGDSVAFTVSYAVTFKQPQPGTSQAS